MQAMLSFLPNSTDTVLVTAWLGIERQTFSKQIVTNKLWYRTSTRLFKTE
jgi:hypothetical protein